MLRFIPMPSSPGASPRVRVEDALQDLLVLRGLEVDDLAALELQVSVYYLVALAQQRLVESHGSSTLSGTGLVNASPAGMLCLPKSLAPASPRRSS